MSAAGPVPDRQERAESVLPALLHDALTDARASFRGHAGLWLLTLGVSALLYPFDPALLDRIQDLGLPLASWAEPISQGGKFWNSTLLVAVLLAVGGWIGGRTAWRRAALACLVAGIIAGLAVLMLRPALGRARPHAAAEPGFHWMESDPDLGSMPSGHTMTNFASAVAVARVLPPLAVPAVGFATAVGWSRMQLNRHYPTDVLWGAVLGGSIGWAVGGAATRPRRS